MGETVINIFNVKCYKMYKLYKEFWRRRPRVCLGKAGSFTVEVALELNLKE